MLSNNGFEQRLEDITNGELKIATGKLMDVDTIKNQIEKGYVEPGDHYHLKEKLIENEINNAIESVKNPSVSEAIETAPERAMLLDIVRDKTELNELTDLCHHSTNAMRIQIERNPEIRYHGRGATYAHPLE